MVFSVPLQIFRGGGGGGLQLGEGLQYNTGFCSHTNLRAHDTVLWPITMLLQNCPEVNFAGDLLKCIIKYSS